MAGTKSVGFLGTDTPVCTEVISKIQRTLMADSATTKHENFSTTGILPVVAEYFS